jgi:transcriptional regulator with XRE-family HTH domain
LVVSFRAKRSWTADRFLIEIGLTGIELGFQQLLSALIRELRSRVENGQLTERGLARLAGLSQPHLHHILRGKRGLTPAVADRMLEVLSLDLPSLLRMQGSGAGPESGVGLTARRSRNSAPGLSSAWEPPAEFQDPPVLVPILDGLLGPGYPRPLPFRLPRYLPVPRRELPPDCALVAARLGEDPRMEPLFSANDLVVIAMDPAPPSFGQSVEETAWVLEDGAEWRLELPFERSPWGLHRDGFGACSAGGDGASEPAGAAGKPESESALGAGTPGAPAQLPLFLEGVGEASSTAAPPTASLRVGIVVLCIRRMGPLRLPLLDGVPA